jgi:hypothetical protein
MSAPCIHYACRCARAAELAALADRTGDARFLVEAIAVHDRPVTCRAVDDDDGDKRKGEALSEHTLGDAPIQAEYIGKMNKLARFIDQRFNGLARGDKRKVGFVLLVFPFGSADGRCNFISNGADRADIASLFREMAARFEGMPESKGGRA